MKKYPNPKNHPILKDIHFPFSKLEIRQSNNKGNVMKLIKNKLYGGRL